MYSPKAYSIGSKKKIASRAFLNCTAVVLPAPIPVIVSSGNLIFILVNFAELLLISSLLLADASGITSSTSFLAAVYSMLL